MTDEALNVIKEKEVEISSTIFQWLSGTKKYYNNCREKEEDNNKRKKWSAIYFKKSRGILDQD